MSDLRVGLLVLVILLIEVVVFGSFVLFIRSCNQAWSERKRK